MYFSCPYVVNFDQPNSEIKFDLFDRKHGGWKAKPVVR